MKKNKLSKTESGFTMMELLAAVAILVVLFAVSAPAVNVIKEKLAWNKANGIAKEIFVVAQNQSIHMRSNNALDSFQNSVYGTSTNPGACYTQKVTTKPSDYTKSDSKYKNLYYIAGNQSDPISYILPNVTQQSITGSYLVEINPNSGDVYGVFYSEELSSAELVSAYETGMSNDEDTFRDKASRKEDKIGYYGGTGSAGLSMDTNNVTIEAYNEEQLYVKVNVPDASYDNAFNKSGSTGDINFSMEFVIADEHGNKIIRSGSTANLSGTDINKPIFVRNNKMGTTGSVDAYLILDDYINSTSNTFGNLNKGLMPGDDITIYAQACYISTESKYVTTQLYGNTNSVTVNSLFADGTDIVTTAAKNSDGTYKSSVVKVANCRHLFNLRNFRNDAEWAKTDEGREIRVNQKVIVDQTDDIDFAKLSSTKTEDAGICPVFRANGTVDASDGVDDCSLNFKSKTSYDTITNYYLFGTNSNNWGGDGGDGFIYSNHGNTYDGHGNEIQNLIIASSAATGSGLFGKFNAVVKDVHLRNIRVTSICNLEKRPDGRRYVGALVGWGGSKTRIRDCGVYCSAYKEQDKYPYDTSRYSSFEYSNYYIEGRADVGGLVGRVENGASVTDSFAAIDVKVESGLTDKQIQNGSTSCNSFGGLIGRVPANSTGDSCSTVVRNCYSSGKVTGTFDTGGLIGVCYGTVSNCYTTSIIKPTYRYVTTEGSSYSAGGIIGKLQRPGTVDSCNFYGSFEKLDSSVDWASESVGVIIDRSRAKSLSSRVTNCKYIVMDGYNDDLSTKTSETAASGYACATECAYDDASIKANNSESKSFGYREDISDKAFPFNFISTIGYHYGNWAKLRVKPSLAYYEIYYKGNSYAGIGFQTASSSGYPSLLTQSKLDEKGWYVYEAGYGMLKSGDKKVTMKIKLNGGTERSLSLDPTKTINISDDEIASLYSFKDTAYGDKKQKAGSFYDTIVIDGTTYYYNCDVAKQAKAASTTPSTVEIRTAKQFNNLGAYTYLWQSVNSTKLTFSQTLDIDYETYPGASTLANRPIGTSQKIGTTSYEFTNNYNGHGNEIIGYNLQSTASITNKAIGVFGSVGADATIQNVHLVSSVKTPDPVIHTSYSSSQDCSTGGLVGYLMKDGTVKNCTISGYSVAAISTGGTQTGYVTVGGLVGTSYGTVTNCSSVNKEVRITTDKTIGYNVTPLSITDDEIVGIGGIVGAYRYGTLSYSYAGGTLKLDMTPNTQRFAADSYVAGIAGATINIFGVDADIYREATNCYSYCSFDIPTHSRKAGVNLFGYYQNVYGGGVICNSGDGSTNADACYFTIDTALTAMSDMDFRNGAFALTLEDLATAGAESPLRPSAANTHPWTESLKGQRYPNMSWVKAGDGDGSPVHYGDWVDSSGGPIVTPTPEPTPEPLDQAAPNAPTANSENITKTSITLNEATGGGASDGNHGTPEYARSDTNKAPDSGWQTERTFDGLTAGKTYYFFARYAASEDYNQSPASTGSAISTKKNKLSQSAPNKPSAASRTSTSVTLNAASGGGASDGTHSTPEYAISTSITTPISDLTWQTSTTFKKLPNGNSLSPATTYYFYARYSEDDNYLKSDVSVSLLVTKATQSKPNKLTASSITPTSITLNAASGGVKQGDAQYAINTVNTAPTSGWKTEKEFTGLKANTTYYFFARYAGNDNFDASPASEGADITTKKYSQDPPPAPSASSSNITTNKIVLNAITQTGHGAVQYAMGTSRTTITSEWSTNRTFTGLSSGTEYYFFARYAGDNQYYPSEASVATVTTVTIDTVGFIEIYQEGITFKANIKYFTYENGTASSIKTVSGIERGSPEYNAIVGPSLKDENIKWVAGATYYYFWNVNDYTKWKYRVAWDTSFSSNNACSVTIKSASVIYKYNNKQVGSKISW